MNLSSTLLSIGIEKNKWWTRRLKLRLNHKDKIRTCDSFLYLHAKINTIIALDHQNFMEDTKMIYTYYQIIAIIVIWRLSIIFWADLKSSIKRIDILSYFVT